MAATLTHASKIVNQLEYVEESTEGTIPTNPAMVFLANVAKWTPKITLENDAYRRHGGEDFYKMVFGRQVFESTFEFGITNSTFLKYGISAVGGGSGTTDKSLSIGFSFKLNGTTNFVTCTRSRVKTLKITGDVSKPTIMVQVTMAHDQINTPSASDYIGAGSHATADATALWGMASGGANPVTWNAGAIPVEQISVTFTREVGAKWILGSQKASFMEPSLARTVKGDLTNEYTAVTLETDAKAGTARTLAWVLLSSTSTLTLSVVNLTDLTDRTYDADSKEPLPEKWGFQAQSAAIT